MAGARILEVGLQEFDKTVADGLTIVDFWAPWCGPCRMQGPVLDQLAEEYPDKVKIAKVNVDNENELARRYSVMTIPTLIFFKNGKMVERLGPSNKSQLKSAVDKHL